MCTKITRLSQQVKHIILQYLNHALDIAMTLGIVDSAQCGSTLPVFGMSLEDAAGPFPLTADHTTHLVYLVSLRRFRFRFRFIY